MNTCLYYALADDTDRFILSVLKDGVDRQTALIYTYIRL